MKLFLATIAICFGFASQVFAYSANDLAFMEGRWQGQYNNLTMISHYIVGNPRVFVGRIYMKDATGKTQYVELLRADSDGTILTLTPYPMGKKGAVFFATAAAQNTVTFQNPQNSYPSKIVYFLDGAGALVTHVQGIKNGQPVTLEFRQFRIKE